MSDHRFSESQRREVDVDEGAPPGEHRRYGSVTWIALGLGVALTLLLMRFGIWFFFLPIIIPFGLRGRSLLGGSFRGRRFIRLEHSTLSFDTQGFTGSSRAGAIDVQGGVFISVTTSGFRVNGLSESAVRVVGSDGAFEVLISDVALARRIKRRVVEMLERESVRLVDATSILQGGVTARSLGGCDEVVWGSRRTRSWGGAPRTSLRVDGDGWALQIHSGSRLESSTGGPGVPLLRLATLERMNPFESGIVERELVLEIESEGEVVARVGSELSEPELRFIASRLSRAQPRALAAR